LWAAARVRVQQPLRICLECRSKSKKCDKQLTHIVRVMGQALLFVLVPENCLGRNSSFLWSKIVQQIVMLPEIILLRRGGKIFKFYSDFYFASSLTKLWLRIGLCGFGNVLANAIYMNQL